MPFDIASCIQRMELFDLKLKSADMDTKSHQRTFLTGIEKLSINTSAENLFIEECLIQKERFYGAENLNELVKADSIFMMNFWDRHFQIWIYS